MGGGEPGGMGGGEPGGGTGPGVGGGDVVGDEPEVGAEAGGVLEPPPPPPESQPPSGDPRRIAGAIAPRRLMKKRLGKCMSVPCYLSVGA
jgi:hypothetical protein